MKKVPKKPHFLFKVFLSLAVIVSLGSCINECDLTSSTVLILQFDSAGKEKDKMFSWNYVGSDKAETKTSDTLAIPLNLSEDLTAFEIQFLKSDKTLLSEKTTIEVGYFRKPFNRGPDCGMDIKIKDLRVNPTILREPIDSIKIVNSQLSANGIINVKIHL